VTEPAGGGGITRGRLVAFAVVTVLAVAGAGTFVLRQAGQHRAEERAAAAAEARTQRLDVDSVRAQPQRLVVRDTAPGPSYGRVALVPLSDPDGPRALTGISCERVYMVEAGGFCLSADRDVVTTYRASILGRDLHPVRDVKITGSPSRARLSPDGSLAASTVFVAGHSYQDGGFSTATEVVQTTTGRSLGNLESFRVVREGAGYRATDRNFWGVTFADDTTFYATMGTGGRTYLTRGDLHNRELTVLRENAECPSLSPDGRHLVYKKRYGPLTTLRWRFTVLDLASGTETPLPEERSIDDQVAWLDNQHVLYAVPRGQTGRSDVWVSPLAGGSPRLLVPDAESPAATAG
jgi:hypothetical protein